MQRLVALVFVLYFTCVLTQNVGSKTGPCDATYIPPPYDKPLTIFDSTEAAQSINFPCGNSYSYAPIVWYQIYAPLGTNITLSTCGLGTNFDTMIFVFTGNCSSLSCLTYNDQATCSINLAPGNTTSLYNTSTLSFNGTDSFVFIGVGGYYYSSGDFQLTITVVNKTSSDNGTATNNNFGCQNATNIYGPYSPELTVFANNINATTGFNGFNSTTCAITSNQYSVWYKIFPVIGERLNITTCNSATDFDTIISVFSGSSCSSLSCTARSDDSCVGYRSTASSVSFIPTSSSYYVVVSGYNSAYGTYELSISQETSESSPPESTTTCANADLITLGTVYNSSLVGAPLLANNSCAIFANRSANWYELTLSYTKNVTASTCFSSTNFDTVLLVFSGSCSNLSCVGYNDDAPCSGSSSVSSTISFTAYANITYYIAVANYTTLSGTAGNYSLRVV